MVLAEATKWGVEEAENTCSIWAVMDGGRGALSIGELCLGLRSPHPGRTTGEGDPLMLKGLVLVVVIQILDTTLTL